MKEKEANIREVTDLIREFVRESIMEASTPDLERAVQSTATLAPCIPQKSGNSSESEDTEGTTGFDFTLIEPFANSVKQVIGW